MIRKVLYATLASAALMVGAAHATETIVWWDFLSGGDGVRMKAMLDQFNKEHAGKVQIDATTLEWGVPFYTKVQTSAATGQGPDVMTYHESRMPLGVSTGRAERAQAGRTRRRRHQGERLWPGQLEGGAGVDGKQYAVPLDIHSIILYYNKDMLKKAGLLGDDGKPKGLDGVDNFDAALAKLTANGVYGLSVPNDGGTGWRIFYTLLNQQGGQFLKDDKFLDGDNLDKATKALAEMQKWTKNGWAPTNTEYPASIALFTSGKAAMHINGVWEVPTMVDLAKKGQLFDWGAVQIPVLFSQPATWATRTPSPSPTARAIRLAREAQARARHHPLVQQALARVGERRPYPGLPAGAGKPAFKDLEPNANIRRLAKTAVFDPGRSRRASRRRSMTRPATTSIPAMTGEIGPRMPPRRSGTICRP